MHEKKKKKKTEQHPAVAKTRAQRPRWFVECDNAELATRFRHDALAKAQVQMEFQDPKMEIPTIYKYIRPM